MNQKTPGRQISLLRKWMGLTAMVFLIQSPLDAQWSYVGSAAFTTGTSTAPHLKLDNNGVPHLAFKDGNASSKCTVMKYDGSSWVTVGSAGFSAGSISDITMVFDASNNLYVAYQDGGNSNKATVMTYNGSNWATVGTAGFSAATATYPHMAIDGNGTLYVGYSDNNSAGKITVKKYNGSSWVTVGSAGFTPGNVDQLDLEIDGNNTPYVTFTDNTNSFKANVVKFDGSNWVYVGAANFSSSGARIISLAFASDNTPYILFEDEANSNKATVMYYNGSSWAVLGSAGFSTSNITFNSIRFYNNKPYVAYNDTKANVKYYDGSNWVTVGSASFSAGTANIITMDINPANRLIYVGYFENSTGNKASVMVSANTWTGTSGTAWTNNSNWYGDVPISTNDVWVPAGCTNYPNITGTATPVCNKLVIQSGGSVTVGSGGTLSIYGSISNSGTFTATSGKIVMAGSTAQTIPASTFSSNTIQDLEIANSAGVTLSGALGITGTLTPTSGTFTTGGFLTLKSTASGTGRIAAGSGSYISGTITMERYIPGGKRAFRFIGNPTTGTLTLSSLQDNIYITGSGGTTNGFDSTKTQNPSAFWYDHTASAPGTWTAFTHTSTDNNWTSERGIRILVRGDRTQPTTLTGVNPTPNAVTINITGTLKTGNQNISLTNTGSYHLLANPYASPVDIGTVIGAAINIGTQYWVWDPQSGTRGAYITQLKSGGAYSIPSMGAFMVLPTGSSTLAFTESNKTSAESNGNTFFRNNGITDVGEIKLLYNGYPSDNIFLRRNPTALNGFDAHDGKKLWNPDMSFYFISDSNDTLGIDTRPLSGTVTIPLGIITNTTAANYAISLDRWNINGYDIFIKDKLLNIEQHLTPGNDYSFTTTVGNIGASRFNIILRPSGVLPLSNVQLSAQQKGNDVLLQWNITGEESAVKYEIEYSKDGRSFEKIASQQANGSKQYNWLHTLVNDITHYYRIKAIAADGKTIYSNIVKISTGKTGASFSAYPNPVKKGETITVALNGVEKGEYTLYITDAMGKVIHQQAVNAAANQTFGINTQKSLPAGNYIIHFTNQRKHWTSNLLITK